MPWKMIDEFAWSSDLMVNGQKQRVCSGSDGTDKWPSSLAYLGGSDKQSSRKASTLRVLFVQLFSLSLSLFSLFYSFPAVQTTNNAGKVKINKGRTNE